MQLMCASVDKYFLLRVENWFDAEQRMNMCARVSLYIETRAHGFCKIIATPNATHDLVCHVLKADRYRLLVSATASASSTISR